MKIDVNQINVGDFVQINMKEAATSEIRHYVKEGEWYEVVDKDYSTTPLRIKFTEDFSYWVLECRILTYKKKEEIMKESEQVEWKVGDEFEFKSGNEDFMKDWEYSMNKRYTVEKVFAHSVMTKNDRGESLCINFGSIQKVNPVEELSREEKIKQLRRGDEIYIIPEKIDARAGCSLGLSSEEKYVVTRNDGSDVPIRFGKRGTPHGFWAKPDEIVLLEEKEVDVKKDEAVKEEKEQIGWKVGDKFTIKSNYLGLLEGSATTETIFKVTDVVQDSCRVKFDSTKYGGWRDDGRYINDIIKVEDCCEPIEKQEKEEMEIKVGDFVKIKKEEFEYLCSCYKKGGGTCNVSQDGEYEVIKTGDRWSGDVFIDIKDLDGDDVNGVYAHRFYKVSKKQEEKEEMEIKVGDFVKIKRGEFEHLCSCYKKGGGTCNVSQDGEYEVVKTGDRWSGDVLIDIKDLDGDVVNGVYAHRFYKVSKKQEEKEEMKSVERTAFSRFHRDQIEAKLIYLNLSQVAKDDILGLVELYVETVVEQKRIEFEQEIDQRYQEKLESLKKVLDI